MNINRRATTSAPRVEEQNDLNPERPARHARAGRPRGAVRRGRHVRAALVALVLLSLAPLPLATESGHAAPGGRPPATEAVRFLANPAASGTEQQPGERATPEQVRQHKQTKPGNGERKPRQGPARARRITVAGCAFRVRGKTWTLLRTCRPTGTIRIPNGVTLNGQNRALIVTGNVAKFDFSVVSTSHRQANLRNLRIEGNAGLTGKCQGTFAGVNFKATGTIANITVRNLAVSDVSPNRLCLIAGIFAPERRRVNILNSTIDTPGDTAIFLRRTVNSTIAGNTLVVSSHRSPQFVATGIDLGETTNLIIRDNDIRGDDETSTALTGIQAGRDGGLVSKGNRFQNLDIGMQVGILGPGHPPANALITDNQLTSIDRTGIWVNGNTAVQILRNTVSGDLGPGSAGLDLDPTANGAANTNTISTFACGIDNDSGVTLGAGTEANSYANNTVNEC